MLFFAFLFGAPGFFLAPLLLLFAYLARTLPILSAMLAVVSAFMVVVLDAVWWMYILRGGFGRMPPDGQFNVIGIAVIATVIVVADLRLILTAFSGSLAKRFSRD